MSARSSRLAVRPDLCDRCGRCIRACPKALVRVTSGYVHIDSSECIECLACADVCRTGAISRSSIPSRPVASASSVDRGEIPTVVVGSRAEAKALRKFADTSEKKKAAKAKSERRREQVERSSAHLAACAEADGTALWSVGDAAIAIGTLAVALVAKQLVLGSQVVSVMPATGQVVARALAMAGYYFIQIIALMYLASRHGMRLSCAFGLGRLGRSWAHRFGSAALVAGLLVITRSAALLWGAFAQAIGWQPPVRAELPAVFGAGTAGLALSVAMVVLATPMVEEMVFRGVVMRTLGRSWGMWPAIVGSAAIFALSHATAWALVPTLVLGVALGWLAWTRESLWPAIALHVLYNGVVVAAAFWMAAG